MRRMFCKGFIAMVLALVISVSDASAFIPVLQGIETVSAFSVSKKTLAIKVGKNKTLNVSDKEGKVVWSSKNKKIAKVDKKGRVTAVAPGETVITAKDSKTGKTSTCTIRCYSLKSPSTVKKILDKQKNGKYKEGKRWTNANPKNGYLWKCAYTYGYGCYGFAAIMSDAIYGVDATMVAHHSFPKIQPGDHVRFGPNGGYHSAIVYDRKGNTLILAEGNFNSSIHWGRIITRAEMEAEGFTVYSRR